MAEAMTFLLLAAGCLFVFDIVRLEVNDRDISEGAGSLLVFSGLVCLVFQLFS